MLFILTLCFTCFGLCLVLVGGNQAELSSGLRIDLAQTGLLVSAFTLGAGGGIVAAGPVFDRAPRRPLFAGSLLWVGAAFVTIGPDTGYDRLLLTLGAAGFGAGAYNTLVNAWLSERYGRESAGPMALVHGCATFGAMVGPPLLGWIAERSHFTRSFQLVGAAHIALAVGAAVLPVSFASRTNDRADAKPPAAVPYRALLPFLGLAFAYIGIEALLTVFAIPYATDGLGLDVSRGRWAISALWAGVLSSRLLLFFARAKQPGRRVMLLAATCTLIATGIGAIFSPASVEVMFFASGLALGIIYPLTMAMVGTRFETMRGTAAGLAGGAGAVGGVMVPWLAGVAGDQAGAGVTLAVAAAVAVILLVSAASVPSLELSTPTAVPKADAPH